MTLGEALKKNKETWQGLNPLLRKTLIIKSANELEITLEKFVVTATFKKSDLKLNIGQLAIIDGQMWVTTTDGDQQISYDSSSIVPVTNLGTLGTHNLVPEFNVSTSGIVNFAEGNLNIAVRDHAQDMQDQIDGLNHEVERLRRAVERFEAITGQRREE